jgi:uncharacterized protein (DUF1015 family)
VPDFQPFRGLRYDIARAGAPLADLVSPPYDVIDDEERDALEHRNPHNAVHLTLPREGDWLDAYQRARRLLAEWRDEGVLAPDPTPRLYRYEMAYADEHGAPRRTVGVIGALGLSSLDGGSVIPHERTLTKAKTDRLNLLRATRTNLEPIWGLTLAHGFSDLTVADGPVVADCVDAAGACHSLAPIDDAEHVAALRTLMGSAPVVIADGHHRYETSLAFRDEIAALGGGPSGADAIMMLVVELAPDQLRVQAIHRLLRGTGRRPLRRRLVEAGCRVEAVDEVPEPGAAPGALTLVDADGPALVHPSPDAVRRIPPVLRDVDSARFEATVVPLLERDEVVDYRHDARACADLVAQGAAQAAVLLAPVPVPVIEQVARGGQRMPQKTTFFAPKPCTGLVLRDLDLS